eukprot:TRINITY_DN4529_c0_g1_i1.p2 TRINITY_DN4529_c0_g1~~TRINITY_DN4529_c0_g1_i1.p2  ORF type:complete len:115 (+),score=28.12 TRINITY_DN4529_c0_g1_i1:642-986(+)
MSLGPSCVCSCVCVVRDLQCGRMSGNSIHIMPIMFTGMAIMAPITAISNINQAFVKFHDVDVTLAKLLYIVINILGLLAGMYKCSSLGLLPTKPADWLQLEQIQPVRVCCCDVC